MWLSTPAPGGWIVVRPIGVGAAVTSASAPGRANPQVSKRGAEPQVGDPPGGWWTAYAAQRGRVCPGAVQPIFSTEVARRSVRMDTALGPSAGVKASSPTVVWSSA